MTGMGWVKMARAGFAGLAVGVGTGLFAWWSGLFDELARMLR